MHFSSPFDFTTSVHARLFIYFSSSSSFQFFWFIHFSFLSFSFDKLTFFFLFWRGFLLFDEKKYICKHTSFNEIKFFFG